MSKFHVEAVFKQFPWLNTMFDPDKLNDAKVGRINVVVFEQSVAKFSDGEYFLSNRLLCRAFFCNHRGVPLIQVGVRDVPCTKLERFFCRTQTKKVIIPETAGEALVRLGEKAMEVRYLVGVEDKKLVIFKPPKTFTIALWLAKERQRAAEEVTCALTAIDDIA